MCHADRPLNLILLGLCAESDLFQNILKTAPRTFSNLENFTMQWIHTLTVTMKESRILP